jgi:quaternary ammonium compound-resistance protein SugE
MPWLFLLFAGTLETIWPVATKYSDGLHRPLPAMVAIAALIANVFLLSESMQTLPVATVYGVLIGLGAVGTSIASMLLFQEGLSTRQIFSLAFIILGVLGLKTGSPAR